VTSEKACKILSSWTLILINICKRQMAAVDYLLVAAIDLGTTYSGYAYSFRYNQEVVHINQAWNAGTQRLISQKTPTCLLLNAKEEFHSFGFDAENKFAELADDDEHGDWLLFRQFKMLLYEEKVFERFSLSLWTSIN
jgi:hypothetical protein